MSDEPAQQPELWPCPRCQTAIPSTSTFCPNCGFQLVQGNQPPATPAATATPKSRWSTRKKVAVGIIAVVVTLVVLGMLAGPQRPGDTAAPGGGGDRPAEQPAQSRCEAASPRLVASIEEGLNVAGGGSLRNAQIVKSNDFENAYFVSADIEGEGMDGQNIATWVTNAPEGGSGLLFSVNALASNFSDWGPGGQTDAQFSMSDDGAQESADCASQ